MQDKAYTITDQEWAYAYKRVQGAQAPQELQEELGKLKAQFVKCMCLAYDATGYDSDITTTKDEAIFNMLQELVLDGLTEAF